MYSRRPWSLVILFFLLLVLAVTSLPFVLGRLVIIETYVQVGSFSIPSCYHTYGLESYVASAGELY